MLPPPPRPTLFPYTTLFRSSTRLLFLTSPYPARQLGTFWSKFRDLKNLHIAALAPSTCQVLSDQKIPVALTASGGAEEDTSELQSPMYVVCRLLLEKKKIK